MRRRRQLLQVSTFPFLAVLLAAMGSLIFLLLVMDRRAKAVSRAKAVQAIAEVAAQREQNSSTRQAEWQRRRQELHALLAQEDQELLSRLQALRAQTSAAVANLQAEEARYNDLQQQLHTEETLLLLGENELIVRRTAVSQAALQKEAASGELTRLSAELEQMERTLRDLMAVRQREQQTYSLVPYYGRRGDNRRPLYLECARDGVIFHPDRLSLIGPSLTALQVRKEIDRRIAAQRTTAGAQPAQTPYLFLLVRPDGLFTYSLAQAAVTGLEIDFGYEFVDQDWMLDFSTAAELAQEPPWRSNAKPPPVQTAALSRANREKTASPLSPRGRGVGGEGEAPGGSQSLPLTPTPLPGGERGFTGPLPTAAVTPEGGQRSLPSGRSVGSAGGVATAPAASIPGPVSWGSPRGGMEGSPSTYSGTGLPNQPEAPARAGTSALLTSSGPSGAAQGVPAGGGPWSSAGRPEQSASGVPVNKEDVPPLRLPAPAFGSNVAGAMENQPGTQAAPGNRGASQVAGTGAEPGGVAAQGGPANDDPLSRLSPPGSAAQKTETVRQPPTPLSRLLGNRDWFIPLDCKADSVVLLATRQEFPVASLQSSRDNSQALVEAVRQLIARRQATVRPGEPPYRPILRFQVQPDGLRTYYLAYSLLEALNVQMTRQNLEDELSQVPNVLRK